MISLPFSNKKIMFGMGIALAVLLLVVFLPRDVPENATRPDQQFTLPAFGNLPDLGQSMRQDRDINTLAQKLLSYDEFFIFVNYPQVNAEMASLMFMWVGMTPSEVRKLGGQKAIAVFLRRVYELPADEPILGHPLLENNPWGDLFNEFKAAILMQGQGHKIYDGLAYYDNEIDQMVVRGDLSEEFVTGFAEFLKTQESAKRKKYLNNFFLFIRETKGFKNLSEKDKALIKKLRN
jgi:hypothetical protein